MHSKKIETLTKWALESFQAWLEHRNSGAKCDADRCPEALLENMDPTLLNKWFAAYVAETRKVNGDPYSPSTLQSLLSGLLHHMQAIDPTHAPNIFDKGNPTFRELHCTMDSLYRQLCAEGVGAESIRQSPLERKTKISCGNLG